MGSSNVEPDENDGYADAQAYHASTKLTPENFRPIGKHIAALLADPSLAVARARAWKAYEGCPKVALPEPSLGDMSLQAALRGRRSQRDRFGGGPITLEQLSAFLQFSYGVTQQRPLPHFPGEATRLRSAASAGALYPLEIYPIVFDVAGCEAGLYHYGVADHTMATLRRGPVREEVLAGDLTSYGNFVSTCAVMLAITGMFPRTLVKYRIRGYRFMSYDTGAVLQNMYLAGAALGLGGCAIGGFYDDAVGTFLGVDNVDENVLMMFCLGQPFEAPAR